MSSPPPSNILLDPLTELSRALSSHAFGISPSSSTIIERSFPITREDRESVSAESRQRGETSERVCAVAKVGVLEGGELEVLLDRRGYTLVSAQPSPTSPKTFPGTTYESLDALLIGVSPLYVQAMAEEVGKRFRGYDTGAARVGEGGDGGGKGKDDQSLGGARADAARADGGMGMEEALKGIHGDEKE